MAPVISPAFHPTLRSVPRRDGPTAVVLIGCGAVSRLFYQPALLELARRRALSVAALVDPAPAAREALARPFPAARRTATVEQVEAPAGSLAIIASPPGAHAAQCEAAFRRGWHVLCEKPMAATAGEGARMLLAAGAGGNVLAVGHYKRFFASSVFIRELCRNGALGRLRSFDIQEGGPFRWPAASPSFFSRRETPGGVLLDLGAHMLDLLLWWLGEPVGLDYADDAMGGLEANALARLTFAGGASGRIHLSRDWETRQLYQFDFEQGRVEWTVNQANALTLSLHGLPAAVRGTLVDPDGVPAWTNPQCFIAQLQNVLAAIRGDEAVRVPGCDGVRVMQLIETCYARRRWLEQPWFGPDETARARQLGGRP